MSLQTLDLNKDLCRCCHAEGSFDDLAQPYSYEGKEEVYSDMIKDSFNIEVSPVPGPLCVVTYKICKKCIDRVQDAFLFKKQVQKCEDLFMEIYKRSFSENKGLGLNTTVKEELDDLSDAGDDYSSMNDFNDEDFCMKSEDSEDDATLKEIKNSKARSKPTAKSKPKKPKEIKRKKIKEEVDKEAEAQTKEAKKKKELSMAYDKFLLTTGPKGLSTFTCVECKHEFKKRDLYTQHIRHVHLKLRPKVRSCYLCKEKVPAHLRSLHMEKVHGRPAPSCGACGKKFAYPFQVLQHHKTYHMGEKKFSCTSCTMTFSTKNGLNRHEKTHSPARPFVCDFCNASFKWKKNLQTHIMMHMDDRRYSCDACQMAFVQKSSLTSHVRRNHPETYIRIYIDGEDNNDQDQTVNETIDNPETL